MNNNKFGELIFDENDVFQSLYHGKIKKLSELNIKNKNLIKQFNNNIERNADNIDQLKEYIEPELSVEEFDQLNQKEWFIPKNYYPNLIPYLFDCCKTQEERDRVELEINLFIQHGMLDVLHALKYLVDFMREHNIVWGVGRGSSVSSYCLYLIGVHKIDSLKYGLDIKEFLKGENDG
jgi:DNA polymerase III alpha subunit